MIRDVTAYNSTSVETSEKRKSAENGQCEKGNVNNQKQYQAQADPGALKRHVKRQIFQMIDQTFPQML